MKIYPSKKQWSRWTLTSKATYVSFVLGIIAIILWVVGTWIQIHYGSSKHDQKVIINSQETIIEKEDDLLKGQEDIKEILLTEIRNITKRNNDELLNKYPLGYCIFGIDYSSTIVPNSSLIGEKIFVIWETADIIEITLQKIKLKFPDLKWLPNNFNFSGNKISFDRKVGTVKEVLVIFNVTVLFELLSDSDKGIIYLIGLK